EPRAAGPVLPGGGQFGVPGRQAPDDGESRDRQGRGPVRRPRAEADAGFGGRSGGVGPGRGHDLVARLNWDDGPHVPENHSWLLNLEKEAGRRMTWGPRTHRESNVATRKSRTFFAFGIGGALKRPFYVIERFSNKRMM